MCIQLLIDILVVLFEIKESYETINLLRNNKFEIFLIFQEKRINVL